MEPLNFKIGTPKPVYFREYDFAYKTTDLDLDVRIAMSVEVTDFDSERYKDASEVYDAVKADQLGLFQECMKQLPEGKSAVKGYTTLVPEAMSKVLSEMGITAKTEVFSFALTEDSQKEYRESMEIERMMAKKDDNGWDHLNFTAVEGKEAEEEKKAREAGLYKVIYQKRSFAGFSSEKIYYAPGEKVEVIYSGLMTDTSYTFYVTVKDHEVKYDDRNFYRITFVMPEHDVEVSCGIQSIMMYNNNNNPGPIGMMGIDPLKKMREEQEKQFASAKQPDEWFCTECGHKNKGGKFCRECGTKKYEKA